MPRSFPPHGGWSLLFDVSPCLQRSIAPGTSPATGPTERDTKRSRPMPVVTKSCRVHLGSAHSNVTRKEAEYFVRTSSRAHVPADRLTPEREWMPHPLTGGRAIEAVLDRCDSRRTPHHRVPHQGDNLAVRLELPPDSTCRPEAVWL